MKKNLIVALILIIIIALYFWDKKSIKEKETAEAEARKIFALPEEIVDHITIKSPQQDTIELAKKDFDWYLASPVADDADYDAIESIKSSFLGAERQKTNEPLTYSEDNMNSYGLDSDSATAVTISATD